MAARAANGRRRGLGALALAFVLGVACPGCFGGGGNKAGGTPATHVTVIRLENATDASALSPYAAAVARLSGGSLRIQIGSNAHSGDPNFEEEIIRDVETGKAELAWVGARAWDSVGVHSFDALIAPFLIDSYPLEKRVLASDMTERMLAGLRPLGLVGLGVLPGPLRRPLGVRKPFEAAADFKGATIGIQRSRVAVATFRALGATTVALPARANLRGVDGYEQQLGAIYGNQYFRVSKAVTANVAFWPRPVVLFTSRRFFDSLPASQRQVLVRAARESIARFGAQAAAEDRSAVASLCRVGLPLLSATPGQLAELKSAVQPVYRSLEKNAQTRSFIAQVRSMSGKRTGEPAFACASSETSSSAPSRTDGVYRMTTTAESVARHDNVPLSQATPENYGDFVLVIDRGRFAFTQENKLACTWQYGRVRIEGDRMMWAFTDGGGIAPTNAENKPGELFTWRWSLFRDTLTLGHVTPADLTDQTWRRISPTPARAYFPKRCAPPAEALP